MPKLPDSVLKRLGRPPYAPPSAALTPPPGGTDALDGDDRGAEVPADRRDSRVPGEPGIPADDPDVIEEQLLWSGPGLSMTEAIRRHPWLPDAFRQARERALRQEADTHAEPPAPGPGPGPGPASQDSRVSRVPDGRSGVTEKVARFLTRYVTLPPRTDLVIASWVVASWLADLWDRFPHLAITSPEKRCGKTLLLRLLELVCRDAVNAANISPAAVYRLIDRGPLTLLLDEAQSLARRGSEAAEVMRELICAGIDRRAKVFRVGGPKFDQVVEFPIYCPKVIALIGQPDGVVADRCLSVRMRRKSSADRTESFRSRVVEPSAETIRAAVEAWAVANRDRVREEYDSLEPFPIPNDRMAELLLPLQAVLAVDDPVRLTELRAYADALEAGEREAERMTPGVRLLTACREIFARVPTVGPDGRFLPTTVLLARLVHREEEPWATYTRGGTITAEALATLLRTYGIHSRRNRAQTARGYAAADFAEAWERYVPNV